ncbi:MAG: glycerol-3-phosphate dehydrogenase/oxidase, partial [Bacteroidota bacterium]
AGVEKPDQRIMLSREETLAQEPLLKDEVVEGAGYYAEYRTDDARLTLEVLKTAAEFGARPINYTEVTDFVYENGKVTGAECKDLLSGETYQIKARQVVSAAGPWVDELRDKDGSLKGKRLHLTKGVHIVIPREKMPLKQSVYFDVPDGRMVFAIPRGQVTYIGTTDTDYHGDKNHPRTLKEDVMYLVDGTNNLFPEINLRFEDVMSSWAGLRPLIHEDGKSASELSRKDEIFTSDSGLISIAGGKLTGYRKMAERTVDAVIERIKPQLTQRLRACYTDKIDITGGKSFPDATTVDQYRERLAGRLASHGLGADEAWYLVHNYGDQADEIVTEMDQSSYAGEAAMIDAELRFCVAHEMVQSAVDFFSRRTGRMYFNIHSVRTHREQVLRTLEGVLQWSAERITQEKAWLDMALEEAAVFPETIPA